ncbi:hypothetical protein AVEN_63470-1 [Araneus ventricosus]|uniref:Uncharacterized protein n=1 Tax=Araneus ventricosus TaxID=182803 RepID=A0A4Y2CUS8_ARAVE|nr:hypothetical protein AVEN_63470-1 [Araneus ventricosus]
MPKTLPLVWHVILQRACRFRYRPRLLTTVANYEVLPLVASERAVAVFSTGVEGDCFVPRESRGTQNLFAIPRSAEPTANLGHWVGEGVLKAICACGLILTKSATENGTLICVNEVRNI